MAKTRNTYAKHENLWTRDGIGDVESARLEQRLQGVLQSPQFQAEIRSVPTRYTAACKLNMCRIESEFPPSADANDWLGRLMMDMGGGFGNSTVVALPDVDGAMKVVVFAYRPGRQPH